jgi:hypothetical protein
MATKQLPQYIKVNGHVYRLAAEPNLDELKQKLLKQKQDKQDIEEAKGLKKNWVGDDLSSSLSKIVTNALIQSLTKTPIDPGADTDPDKAYASIRKQLVDRVNQILVAVARTLKQPHQQVASTSTRRP